MNYKYVACIIFLIFFNNKNIYSQNQNDWNTIIGSAMLENKSYDLLEKICDEVGGRMMGSPQNEKGMKILEDALKEIGFNPTYEKFNAPGWYRGNDEVIVKTPFIKKLKAVASGYVDSASIFEAEVVYASNGYEEDYKNIDVKDKIVLVTREKPKNKDVLITTEFLKIAINKGAKAILFISDNPGTLVIARTGSFQGYSVKIPAFNISYEEGKWIERLIKKKIKVTIEITTKSYCKKVETANLVATLPGKVKEAIVVGAHFDSWDLGQGAIDNGQGSAILFDLARIFKKYFPENYYTINFVWFNGEEFGLFGSKKYVEMHSNDKIITMINMDMTGIPQGFNCMGFDEFVPFLENITNKLSGFDLTQGVISSPWTNSDHEPFMLKGIPSIAVMGHLEEDMYKYYHEMGDSFDKVNKKYISEAVAILGVLIKELANNKELNFKIKSEKEMVEMLTKFNIDKTLKMQGEWIYK